MLIGYFNLWYEIYYSDTVNKNKQFKRLKIVHNTHQTMYELLYILLYYSIFLSALYCYKRYKEDHNLIEYEYRQLEMTDINGNYHIY